MTAEQEDDTAAVGSGSTTPTRTFTAPAWHSTPEPRPTLLPSTASPTGQRRTLKEVYADLIALLRVFIVLMPVFVRRLQVLIPRPFLRLGAAVAHQVAVSLHHRDVLASYLLYDILVIPWRAVVSLFFREIKSRGAWRIPLESEGTAVVFVAGPHANQVSSRCASSGMWS